MGQKNQHKNLFHSSRNKRNCLRLFTRNCKSFVKYNSIKRFNFYLYKMTQYSRLKLKLSNLQLNILNSAIKSGTGVVLRLSSTMAGDDEASFPHNLLLTSKQIKDLRKAFSINSSTDIKLSKKSIIKDGTIRRISW